MIQGKREQIHLALVCLLAEGHLLIEDVPGVGKTSLAKAIAASIGGTCHRIQFTPDLLPSDVTGVSVWNRTANEFEFRPGGIFANVVLADEINRASPKTQSALLEAMEERQVTVDAAHLPLAPTVHGDRHPESRSSSRAPIRSRKRSSTASSCAFRWVTPGATPSSPSSSRRGDVRSRIDDARAGRQRDRRRRRRRTRRARCTSPPRFATTSSTSSPRRGRHPDLVLGASPRGSLSLQRAARALAASFGRAFVIPDDVKRVMPAVLEHRFMLAPDAQLRGVSANDVVRSILASVPVPGATGG